MPVPLKDILMIDSLKSADLLIKPSSSATNEVKDIMVIEAPDVENWCNSGQLLLSSLYSFQEYSDVQQIDFIERLAKLEISGLIVKINRFVESIPSGILTGCQLYQVPLIQISNDIRYSQIIVEGMQLLFDHRARLLNHYRQVHNHFSKLALNQASIMDILQALANFIKNPVSLCTEAFVPLATTDQRLSFCDIIEQQAVEERNGASFSYQRKLVSHPNFKEKLFWQIAIPIHGSEASTQLLIIHEINHDTEEMDFMAIENAAIALQLDLLKQAAVSNVKQNYHNELFDDLIYGKCSNSDQQIEYAHLLKLDEQTRYRVVVWQFSQGQPQLNDSYENRKKQLKTARQLMNRILQYYPNTTYRIRSNQIIFLLEAKYFEQTSPPTFSQHMHSITKNWTGSALQLMVGISETTMLTAIHLEAQKALQILQQAQALKLNDFILFYQDLGIYRMLAELEQTNQLASFIPRKLSSLIETNPEWIATLKSYLDENQNLKKTADKLFVHYKTVTYRINKIKELTGIEFNNPEEVRKRVITEYM